MLIYLAGSMSGESVAQSKSISSLSKAKVKHDEACMATNWMSDRYVIISFVPALRFIRSRIPSIYLLYKIVFLCPLREIRVALFV